MAARDFSESFSNLIGIIKDYVNTRVDFVKLVLLQKITRAGVLLLTFVSAIISAFAACVFLMFSFSFWYGDKTGNLSQGFLISAAIFVLIVILIFLLRKVVFGRILVKTLSRILFSDEEND
jgi:hypothetical protein